GLFGTEEEIGKTVGSDIVADKKTLYRIFLYNAADEKTRTRLDTIFGNPSPAAGEINEVLELIHSFGVDEMVSDRLNRYADRTRELIQNEDSLQNMPPHGRKMLEDLLDFNLNRSA
ncbi:MAG: hypothetical protein ACOCRN_01220, partial [Spirochaetia bacterium]